jgi:hypothetical protein
MYVWTNLTAQTREPSPLLIHLAGEFADRIAALWPAPHGPFVTAGTGQRHLLCILLARGLDARADAEAVLSAPVKRAVRTWFPAAPAGLVRAIVRLGETAWSAADYQLLLDLLTVPEAAKVINHATLVDVGLVRTLDRLPRLLLRAGITNLALTPTQAMAVGEAFALIERRAGPWGAVVLADRWAGSKSVKALFERVREDLMPDLPPPPFPGTPRLRPLETKAAIRDAAKRFRNCLAGEISQASEGWGAFYEWLGPPGAVVEIRKDAYFGWSLSEVRLQDNNLMPEADRGLLIEELRAMGVHVGRTRWMLDHALWQAADPAFELEPADRAVAHLFGD